MKNWLHNNLVQILIVLVSVTFGYAHFTSKIDSTAAAQEELKAKQTQYEKDMVEIKGDIKTLLERTKKL